LRRVYDNSARFSSFARFFRIAVDFFADNSLRGFVEPPVERVLEFEIFRPEGFIDERARRAHHHGGVALAVIAIGLESIAAAERREETPLPAVGKSHLDLHRGFGSLRRCDGPLDSIDRGCGGSPFSAGRGAFEKGGNLAQFVAQLLFGCHLFLML
jgi:hypothetical protein